jgi:dienelactone hydrolase
MKITRLAVLAVALLPPAAGAQGFGYGDLMMERFLAHEAASLSQQKLAGARTLDEWQARRPRLQREFLDMLGLWPMPEKTLLRPVITGTLERDDFVIEKLHFQSRPGLYVTANLYRPKKVEAKLPAVVFFMGHYNRGRNGHKAFMQDHGMWFARNGYVCIILDTIERSELPGLSHLGLHRNNNWWWQSAGFTPAGIETWNGIRAIDYLVSRPEVDPERIAATGLSGGGTMTFFVSAVDDRVRCAVPASGFTDVESNVVNHMQSIHCDCQLPHNIYRWDFTTLGALIAPRPMLFVNSHDDLGFPMAANRRIYARFREAYELHGKPEMLDEFVSHGPRGSHSYLPDSRVAIFRWINKHLKHDSDPVKDVNDERFPEEQLRVFPEDKDFPPDAINLKIDETFVPRADVKLPAAGGFDAWKKNLLAELRAKPFRSLPERVPISDRAIRPGLWQFKELLREDLPQTRTTEIGINVALQFRELDSQAEPREKTVTLLVLDDEDDFGVPAWAKDLVGTEGPLVVLAPRGVGPGRYTKQSPPNFVERAHVLLGRTIDQGRVWDIAATAHWLERKPGVRVVGRGQAGVLAAYAALFEPAITELVVVRPTSSHKEGPHFLHVLRVLDIPDALGMLAPRPLTLIDAGPAFERTERIYASANSSDKLKR